jgi:geranylgeranyl diphosphate synthase type I
MQIILSKISQTVNPAIEKVLLSSVFKKHQNIIKYQIGIGGKRIRPALAILSCRMMGGKTKDCLYPAAALEILHNYTLIVDDIVDHGETRRKKPTTWKKYGKAIAELVSMNYAASIFDVPVAVKNRDKINQVLSKTLKAITDGQILDVLFEQGGRKGEPYVAKNRYSQISVKDYFIMVRNKTASLFSASAEVGGICADAAGREIKLLREFGFNLGMAFQIQDDILDIFGDEKKFGKKIGKDIEERKLGNIVILLAMEEFSLKSKRQFLNIFKKQKINNKDIREGISLIKNTAARERARKLEKSFIRKTKRGLAKLPRNRWNKTLEDLIDYLSDRSS